MSEDAEAHLTVKKHDVEGKHADRDLNFIELDIFAGAIR